MPCIGDGSHHWALVQVDDIAELYVLALNAPAGSVYAGVSQNLPLADITRTLSHAARCLGRNEWLTRAELARLRRENAQLKKDNKELAMERDVLKRCMVLWVK
ncbi:hypothetical protein [Streptomyces hyaluromycini]|uniref:hypothetical protein n=1 Tax=Streptomyces hyaluromycini TaxID=1377993 RepID=UPI000B5C2A2B|nr:hypothetical protein [Streptomyces hyaluromycini]